MKQENQAQTAKKGWAGTALLIISGLHTTFVLFLSSGLANTDEMKPWVGDAAPITFFTPGIGSQQPFNLLVLMMIWSLFAGLALGLFGLSVRHMEQQGLKVPAYFGVAILVFSISGGLLIPMGGFWLGLAPGIHVLVRAKFA